VGGALGHRLDVDGLRDIRDRFLVRLCLFLIVFGKFLFVPGVVAEGGVGDVAWVDYYLLRTGLEGGAA